MVEGTFCTAWESEGITLVSDLRFIESGGVVEINGARSRRAAITRAMWQTRERRDHAFVALRTTRVNPAEGRGMLTRNARYAAEA